MEIIYRFLRILEDISIEMGIFVKSYNEKTMSPNN